MSFAVNCLDKPFFRAQDEVFDYGDVVLNWDKAQTVRPDGAVVVFYCATTVCESMGKCNLLPRPRPVPTSTSLVSTLQVVERIDKLLQSRIKLDNILNLKGNPTTHAIGECCIGCYAHYRRAPILPSADPYMPQSLRFPMAVRLVYDSQHAWRSISAGATTTFPVFLTSV